MLPGGDQVLPGCDQVLPGRGSAEKRAGNLNFSGGATIEIAVWGRGGAIIGGQVLPGGDQVLLGCDQVLPGRGSDEKRAGNLNFAGGATEDVTVWFWMLAVIGGQVLPGVARR